MPYFVLTGLKVSNATFNAIVMRYSDNDGHVRFDDFVACFIKLKGMFGEYEQNIYMQKQAVTGIEKAGTLIEQAEIDTEQAETVLEQAVTGIEHGPTGLEQARTSLEQTGTGIDQDVTGLNRLEPIGNSL